MIAIGRSSSFNRAYKSLIQNNAEIESRYWECVKIFMRNPFDKRLKTHKLSGKLQGLWGFSIGYDLRVVFSFQKGHAALFEDIGTHDDVY